MDAYPACIFISVLVLALIGIGLYFTNRGKPGKGLSRLAALSFAFIIAGIIFGENRLVGYSLLGIGVLLAVIEFYYKRTAR